MDITHAMSSLAVPWAAYRHTADATPAIERRLVQHDELVTVHACKEAALSADPVHDTSSL